MRAVLLASATATIRLGRRWHSSLALRCRKGGQPPHHSIPWWARARKGGGTARPSALLSKPPLGRADAQSGLGARGGIPEKTASGVFSLRIFIGEYIEYICAAYMLD